MSSEPEEVVIDDIPLVENPDENVVVSPTTDEIDLSNVIQLGDTVCVFIQKPDEMGYTIIGNVYYRDLSRIIIKSSTNSSELHIFDLEDNPDEDVFKEEYGIQKILILKKRGSVESFTEQQGFEVGDTINTIAENKQIVDKYTIVTVNIEDDFIIVKDENDNTTKFEFEFTGIPSELDFIQIVHSINEATNSINQKPYEEEKSDEIQQEQQENENEDIEESVQVRKPVIVFHGSFTFTLQQEIREAKEFEQQFPNELQKSDALNDFTLELSDIDKKNPDKQRQIRILVDTLFYLKQMTVAYSSDDKAIGPQSVSAKTMDDLIRTGTVPLGRPVLGARKKLYIEEELIVDDDIICVHFGDELDEMLYDDLLDVSDTMSAIRYQQRTFLTKYLSPWEADTTKPIWSAHHDTDFFREVVPSLNENGEFNSSLAGYLKTVSFDTVPFGIERALSTTYYKQKKDVNNILVPEDAAFLKSYLLFPTYAIKYLGAPRSNNIAFDSYTSILPRKTMRSLLYELGEPVSIGKPIDVEDSSEIEQADEPREPIKVVTTNNILVFNPDNENSIPYPIVEYIKSIPIHSTNMHQVMQRLIHFGLNKNEIHISLLNVLQDKLTTVQNKYKTLITNLRELLQQPVAEPEQNYIINPETIISLLKGEKILMYEITQFNLFNPSLVASDIGIMSHLLKKYGNYVQIVFGQNSMLIPYASDHAQLSRDIEKEQHRQLERLNTPYIKPLSNPCKHVSTLAAIRKKRDDIERFQDLTAFYKKYQGERNGNWINCNVCEKELICIHERLQIQGFLQPREKARFDKEIILSFADGFFQGRSICRNCGQSIRDFEFDNTMEFDDNGRPKSGNAVVIDDAELIQSKIDAALNMVDIMDDKLFDRIKSEEQILYYIIIRKIIDNIDKKYTIEKIHTLINRITTHIQSTIIPEILYNKDSEILYSEYRSKYIISVCIACLLLDLQCAMPGYDQRYTVAETNTKDYGLEKGLDSTLNGYPLDTTPDNDTSIVFMSFIALVNLSNEIIYADTDLQTKSKANQLSTLIELVKAQIEDFLKNQVIQESLIKKRQYMIDEEHKLSDKLSAKNVNVDEPLETLEHIPLFFLPAQIPSSAIIIPEVAAVNKNSRLAYMQHFIHSINIRAKESAIRLEHSPFLETSCCHVKISEPGITYENEEMIGMRILRPKQLSVLLTEFKVRPIKNITLESIQSVYYMLFLKCCYKGMRFGQSHEPDLTNKCIWCDFEFPCNPRVMDKKDGEKELARQNITITPEAFNTLLHKIHALHAVTSDVKPKDFSMQKAINEFDGSFNTVLHKIHKLRKVTSDVKPKDLSMQKANNESDKSKNEFDKSKNESDGSFKSGKWSAIVTNTFNAFVKLQKDYKQADEYSATKSIQAIISMEETKTQTLLPKYVNIINDIIHLPWVTFCSTIRTYFIIPFQRLLTTFSHGSLRIPYELMTTFSTTHIKDDIQKPILDPEFKFTSTFNIANYAMKYKGKHNIEEEIKTKIYELIRIFIDQLIHVVQYKDKFQFRNIVSSDKFVLLINSLSLYGSFNILLHTYGNEITNYMINVISFQLKKYAEQKLVSDPTIIKARIESRNEKERTDIISKFDKLNPEERRQEIINKRLGIGKWAIGGTKAIYKYDKEYYDLEREKRLDAGIIDFPGMNAGLDGPQVDELGFSMEGDEDGYDNNQHGDDDYE